MSSRASASPAPEQQQQQPTPRHAAQHVLGAAEHAPLPARRLTWKRAALVSILALLVVLVCKAPKKQMAAASSMGRMVVAPNHAVLLSSSILNLTILTTNDLHSAVTGIGPESIPNAKRGGFAHLSSHLKAIRANPDWQYLTLDAGDWYAGSLFDRLGPHGNSSSVPELEYFLASGYDAVNLGNHDFDSTDKGLAHMLRKMRAKGQHLDIVSSNIRVASGPLAEFVQPHAGAQLPGSAMVAPVAANMTIRPYVVKTLAARDRLIRVGILGIFGPDAALCSTSARGAATFAGFREAELEKDFEELGAHTRAMVEHLREEEEVDFVIAMLHGGLDEAQEILARAPGIDIVASGHTHETYFASLPTEAFGSHEARQAHVIQCSHSGRMLGQMRLFVDASMRLHLAEDPACIDVDQTHGEDHHVSSLIRGWQTELPTILNSSFAYEQVVFRGRDGYVFNSSHNYIEHALTVSNLLLSQVNRHLRVSGIPEADIYLTCPTCVRARAHSLNGEVVLQYSDIYRMLSISTQCDMVVFHMRKEDLWMVLNFVVILERVFSELFVLTVGGVQYDVPAWGIPFVNYFSNLRLVREDGSSLPYAEWPALIRVATSTYIGKHIWKAKKLSYGFVQTPARDAFGNEVSMIASVVPNLPAEYNLLAESLFARSASHIAPLPASPMI